MTEIAAHEDSSKVLPSVDDIMPNEEGGPIARSGFNYQDEIAVSFLIEMLENPLLLKMHCETHDDIVLVRTMEGSEGKVAEFVQVKASEPDKLWSISDLCSGKAGRSIFEISLARDKHRETSRFRIVTLRPVSGDLKMLTFPFGVPGREADGKRFKALKSELDKRFPGVKSKKGNGASYWLENCLWDERHSAESVRKNNLLQLLCLSVKEGRPLLPEPAEVLLEGLCSLAKVAGKAKWEPDRDKKIITREQLRTWWERCMQELLEGAAAMSGGKLKEKMIEAGLPDELVSLAIEMRRDYASAARTSRYMEPEERERLQRRVKSEVMSLRASYVAGQLDLNGAGFHALCLARMDSVSNERLEGCENRSAFLKGCMYDIADRCLVRFARPEP